MRWIFSFLFSIVLFFSLSCNRIELDYHSVQKSQSILDPLSSLDSEGRRKDILLTRSSQDNFQEAFISSKLDMVFILDTHKTRADFYSKNFLGYDFLSFFNDYDWRLAWTDMSIDIKALKDEKTDNKSKSKCGFFSNLVMTVGGTLTGSSGITGFGLKGLSNCISQIDLRSSNKNKNTYANGSFLPFESNQKYFQLNKTNPYSNAILNKSLTLPNAKDKTYKAPLLRESKSFPLLSLFFSISKNLYTQSNSSFFREDSLVVFVLFSLEDSKLSLSAETLKESLHTAFEPYDRFKLILVTLTDKSHIFCPLYYEDSSKTPKKLTRLVQELEQPILDICSQNLGEELFNEVSKGLSSQELL